jgi:HSP20 family protein
MVIFLKMAYFLNYINEHCSKKRKDMKKSTIEAFETLFDVLSSGTDFYKTSPFTTNKNWHSERQGDDYVLQLSLPGYSKEDLEIKVESNLLVIRHESDSGEIWKKTFEQKFKIPEVVDKSTISATLKDGILSLKMKTKAEETRNIKIS